MVLFLAGLVWVSYRLHLPTEEEHLRRVFGDAHEAYQRRTHRYFGPPRQEQFGTRLTAVLWSVAASLAFLAVGIRYFSDQEMNWAVAAGGFGLAAVVNILVLWRVTTLPEARVARSKECG